jgi:bacteriorhodopsin
MLNFVFLAGLLIFAVSSTYFYFAGKSKNGLNSAFLVSFVTLISYVMMWQGDLTVVTAAGQPIYWTRWLFYALSCTLLMVEIAQVKGVQGGGLVQLLYLTAIVMFTGFLAARDLTAIRWIHFAISSCRSRRRGRIGSAAISSLAGQFFQLSSCSPQPAWV